MYLMDYSGEETHSFMSEHLHNHSVLIAPIDGRQHGQNAHRQPSAWSRPVLDPNLQALPKTQGKGESCLGHEASRNPKHKSLLLFERMAIELAHSC